MATEPGSYSFLGDKLTTVDMTAALQKVPLFQDLNPDYLRAIARHGQEIDAKAGDVLVGEGDTGRDLILILDGVVRVERDGNTVARLQPGQFFGEMALIDGKPRSASVVADTPARLIAIDHVSFGQLLETQPSLTRQLLVTLCERLRARGETDVS